MHNEEVTRSSGASTELSRASKPCSQDSLPDRFSINAQRSGGFVSVRAFTDMVRLRQPGRVNCSPPA